MKISASIFSNPNRPLTEMVRELDEYGIDFFHVDCKDDLSVFEEIRLIRQESSRPIDLHIISPEPEKFFPGIREHQVEWVTFQLESLTQPLEFPEIKGTRWGIALVSDTPVEEFEPYREKADFVLFMTTTPGESGGRFNKSNFSKIHSFRNAYPGIRIHVDGGVNAEISFILRNMGVDVVVSGSFLVGADSIGRALIDLRVNNTASGYRVSDFMIGKEELPVLEETWFGLEEVLLTIENYQLGFCLQVSSEGKLTGLITNADIRRGLIRHMSDLNKLKIDSIINPRPKVVNQDFTVAELLDFIKSLPFPVLYLPVVDDQNHLTGALTFNNLIKGEL
ncbi:MAG: CBS domain-containing protein [Bacteroidia bacterium]|nr:CBS domain-containing protein [Bacteroidia bacterium]